MHTNTKDSCHLQVLRVIEDSFGYKSILYWETHNLEWLDGNEDFATWSRRPASWRLMFKWLADMISESDFKSVDLEGKHAILNFLDETRARRRSSRSLWGRRRSSIDMEQLPTYSLPATTTQSSFGSPPSVDPNVSLPPSLNGWKEKAKKEIRGLDIKFWSEEGGVSLLATLLFWALPIWVFRWLLRPRCLHRTLRADIALTDLITRRRTQRWQWKVLKDHSPHCNSEEHAEFKPGSIWRHTQGTVGQWDSSLIENSPSGRSSHA